MKNIYTIGCLFLMAFGLQTTHAQYQLNFGLPSRQPDSQLPKSKAAFIEPVRKSYQAVPGELTRDEEGNYTFTKGWEMVEGYKLFEEGVSLWTTSSQPVDWYNATVPGTVLTTLVNQGGCMLTHIIH
ncbi:MAG: hypothetical protein LIP01_13355 [Tannerellaceae bacterium]|nr:hypothetical protein [Tannerellaceae bacterium]